MAWTIHYYSAAVQADILAMQEGFVARYFRYADRLEQFGPDLGMPHTRALGGGLFELRLKAAEGIARVFYVALAGRRIVVLHQFVKKTAKTPPRELDVARRRMKELLNAEP
jgi:phage-related protein